MLTNNKNVLKWVDEMVALCKPDKVVWIDGSEEQMKALRDEAIATGEMIKLNQEKLPGCLGYVRLPGLSMVILPILRISGIWVCPYIAISQSLNSACSLKSSFLPSGYTL